MDGAEIMDGVRDEAERRRALPRPGGDGGGELHAQAPRRGRTVTRDKVVELAQKGLDYDRVRAKLESAGPTRGLRAG